MKILICYTKNIRIYVAYGQILRYINISLWYSSLLLFHEENSFVFHRTRPVNMDLNIESVRKFFLAESNLEMAGNVLRNDHLLRLILVHEGHEVVPLLVRDDDLVPL